MFNTTIDPFDPVVINVSDFRPIVSVSKIGDIRYEFRTGLLIYISPFELEVRLSAQEFFEAWTIAFRPNFVFSTLSLSVASGPFVQMDFYCFFIVVFSVFTLKI